MSRTVLSPLEILHEIDRDCRQTVPDDKATTPAQNFLSTSAGAQGFLIKGSDIVEILRLDSRSRISTIPGAQAWHRGLMSVRGQLVNIIDLQAYLAEKTTETGHKARIIIVRRKQFMSGLLVSHIDGLVKAEDAHSQGKITLPTARQDLHGERVEAHGKLSFILDLDQLFADPRFSQATAD